MLRLPPAVVRGLAERLEHRAHLVHALAVAGAAHLPGARPLARQRDSPGPHTTPIGMPPRSR